VLVHAASIAAPAMTIDVQRFIRNVPRGRYSASGMFAARS
jgi:hypothetical protein